MATFSKNQVKNFYRNESQKKDTATIVAVVPKPKNLKGEEIDIEQQYIIEYAEGWTPDPIRVKKLGLDKSKKYIFVKESELS
jgi:hypothetical protein